MQMENKKTAVIYARQSYGKEESALSVDQQIERCKAWCERNGVEIIGEFKDNNTSSELYPNSTKGKAYCATDIGWQRWRRTRAFKNRKAYRQGLADAFDCIEQHKTDYFVVDENTRFYRNPSATSQLDIFCIVQLQEAKTALVNVTENKIDPLKSNIDIAIWRAFAQYETEKMNEKADTSRANRRANINNGYVYSNAYGIDWINRKISYNAEKAEAIRYVYDSVIQGKTYGEIIYTLNTVYRHLADGKRFYDTSIYNILKNPIYSGFKLLEDGRYIEIKNLDNSPIIPFTTHLKANEIVKEKKENSGRQKYNIKGEKRNFLPFSGLFKCGNCKSKLHSGKDKGRIFYYCKDAVDSKNKDCTPSRITMEWTKDNIYNDIDFYVALQPLFLIHLLSYITELESLKNTNDEISRLTVEIENLKSKIKTITDTFTANGISTDIFVSTIEKLQKETVEKENKLIQLKATSAEDAEKQLEQYRCYKTAIEESETNLEHDVYSRLLRETIKEIIIYKDYITIVLTDDNSFDLPRQKANNYRTKKIPMAKAESFIVDGCYYPIITFDHDKKDGKTKTLLKTNGYEIRIVC